MWQLLEEVHAITRWDDGDEDPEVTGTPEAPAVTLRAPMLPFIGWGLFRLGSMTNHSCWPNAEADFPLDNAALEVRSPQILWFMLWSLVLGAQGLVFRV